MKRLLIAILAVLALAGCAYKPGPAGKVVDRDSYQSCHSTGTSKHRYRSCSTRYELTTQTADGKQHKFAAPWSAYDRCYRGSTYPACIDRGAR